MDSLERRVQRRMAQERRQLHAEQMSLGRKRLKLRRQAEKALGTQERFVALLGEGETPGLAAQHAGRALTRLGSAQRAMLKINAQMAKNSAHLDRLETPGEKNRRILAALAMGAGDTPLSGKDAAEVVILQEGRPMHYTEVTERVLGTGTVRSVGKTPTQTFSSYLAREAAKPDGRFVRIAPGIFDVKRDRASSVS